MSENLSLVRATNLQQTKQLFEEFEQLKNEIVVRETDINVINGKDYYNKSFWNKCMILFNLSKEILHYEFQKTEQASLVIVHVRVSAPNGRYSDNIGVCSSTEKWSRGKSASAMMGMATTRCTNRCISDLVAPGTLSAEEMSEEKKEEVKPRTSFSTYIKRFNACGIDLNSAKAYIQKQHGIPFSKAEDWQLEEVIHHFSPDELEVI